MSRWKPLSLFCIGLMAATAITPSAQAQRDGERTEESQRRSDRGRGPRAGGGFGGMGRGGGSNLLFLLRVDAVRTEIKLTEDQQELVQILGDELREGRPDFPQDFREMTEPEQNAFRAKMQEFSIQQTAQTKETLKTILEESQYKRLQEISIQTQGVNALLDPDVAKSLSLTADQTAQLKATQETLGEEMRSAMREAFQGGRGFDRDAVREQMQKFRTESETQMLGHLTDEQKSTFAELKGVEFDMPEQPSRFRRGAGSGRGRSGSDRPQPAE